MSLAWNSVQVANITVAALIPLTVAFLGLLVARAGRRLETVQWANQVVVTRRLQVFDQVSKGLNQLLCFGTFVGRWKELTPERVIDVKRSLDEIMYANRLLFSDQLFDAYRDFMNVMFAMYAAKGGDALIRAPIASKWGNRSDLPWWHEKNRAEFFESKPSSVDQIIESYAALSTLFREDLYVSHDGRRLIES
jgi:hypothetical protein